MTYNASKPSSHARSHIEQISERQPNSLLYFLRIRRKINVDNNNNNNHNYYYYQFISGSSPKSRIKIGFEFPLMFQSFPLNLGRA